MRTETIRSLDYWLGVPACALLTAVSRALPRPAPERPRRLVFVKFIEQGATVLAQHAMTRAIDAVGRDNVFFCVFDNNRAILDVLDLVPTANVIVIRDHNLLSFVVDFLRAVATIRAQRIDAVIDMEFFSRASAIFAFLTGARTRVGLHRFTGELPYRGDLMTHRVQYLPHVHISRQYAVLLEAAFTQQLDEPLLKVRLPSALRPADTRRFTPTAEERVWARNRLGITDTGTPSPIVLINPNASDLLPLRKWDSGNFIALSKRLLEAFPNARIGVTGAPSERAPAERLCEAIGSDRVTSFAGQTTLRELLALYCEAHALVTNDSGPAHFASLRPIHTVVLFGPETPQLFGSLSPATTILWKELACSPCVSVFNHRLSPCRNNVCMQSITVDEVFSAVTSVLAPGAR